MYVLQSLWFSTIFSIRKKKNILYKFKNIKLLFKIHIISFNFISRFSPRVILQHWKYEAILHVSYCASQCSLPTQLQRTQERLFYNGFEPWRKKEKFLHCKRWEKKNSQLNNVYHKTRIKKNLILFDFLIYIWRYANKYLNHVWKLSMYI